MMLDARIIYLSRSDIARGIGDGTYRTAQAGPVTVVVVVVVDVDGSC